MDFGKFHFGRIEIDGVIYERDVVIDRGRIRKRKKKPSKRFREEFGHTPLSVEEEIPWKCQRLVVGTGRYGSLPVMDEVKLEARRRKVALLILPTEEAVETLANQPKGTNAILHVTADRSALRCESKPDHALGICGAIAEVSEPVSVRTDSLADEAVRGEPVSTLKRFAALMVKVLLSDKFALRAPTSASNS